MNDVPDFVAVRDHVCEEVVRFCRALRRAGVGVSANAGTTALRALVEVGFDDEKTAQAALRACLVTDPDERTTFDRQFPEFWRRLTAGIDTSGPAPRRDDRPEGALAPLGDTVASETTDRENATSLQETDGDAEWQTMESLGAVVSTAADDHERAATEAAWYSPTGTQTTVSGAAGSPEELTSAFAALTGGLTTLYGRRWRTGGDDRVDARRALRTSFATGGTVVSLPHRERTRTRVKALWLVDVSRSVLDTVDRSFLLGVLRRARAEWAESRVFFFDEDAREVTATFDEPTVAAALDVLERAEATWGGGTRIGASLASVHEQAPDAVDRRTVVFVVSDGLEMGAIERLEHELAWISRRAAGVLWLNPLAASSSYEPTARGMASALTFVDGLFAFGTPADLTEVGRQLRRHATGGRIGYKYDSRTTHV